MNNLIKGLRGMGFLEALAFTYVTVTVIEVVADSAERLILATFHGHKPGAAPAAPAAPEPVATVAVTATVKKSGSKKAS